ncbi:hypothetical protein BDQ12DRAFT_638338 [Crucibulum laeve]|uniref:Uncharacterized protein n=1 Tax=Crucibulum laeve TaxID=68775 RepID=A0A5C3LJS2_9AGAR|nr:hypothetical protein BDQ12DRAFT_638338 [Crucibulum laeve]
MPEETLDFSLSTLSFNSTDSQSEDWDRSINMSQPESPMEHNFTEFATTTPRNSVIFPAEDNATPAKPACGTCIGEQVKGKRSLSELLKLHAEKGTSCQFSAEEASRVADVLGQWINASSSPYEGEDDFFARSQDDLSILSKRLPTVDGRPRGQSESANSRPPSSTGFIKTA